MMQARVFVTDAAMADIPVTLTVTLRLSEWRSLMRQIPTEGHPAWAFGALVASAIGEIGRNVDVLAEAGKEVSV